MGGQISFIHAADIHLGSIPETVYPDQPELARTLENASFEAFRRIIDLAVENEVDFVLLSGDIFSQKNRSVQVFERFLTQMRRLEQQDIPSYLIYGNTDLFNGVTDSLGLPSSCHLLADSPDSYTLTVDEVDIQIVGYSYRDEDEDRVLLDNLPFSADSDYTIGMLHTALDQDVSSRIPCERDTLCRVQEVDYWALGHQHDVNVIKKTKPTIVFPGKAQGHNIAENGGGGAMLVEKQIDTTSDQDHDNLNLQYVPVAPVVFQEVSINENQCSRNIQTRKDWETILMEQIQSFSEDRLSFDTVNHADVKSDDYTPEIQIIRWELEGGQELLHKLRQNSSLRQEIESTLRDAGMEEQPVIWTEAVVPNPEHVIENKKELIRKDPVLREFFELSSRFLAGEEEQRKLENMCETLWYKPNDHEDDSATRFPLSKSVMNSFVDEAKEIIIDEMVEKR